MLIVEEAAEILEAHVLASISKNIKHVILIGTLKLVIARF